METYEVHFLQEVLDDLEEIILHTAQSSCTAAIRLHDKIMEKANDLSIFPKRGRTVPDKKMANTGYRILMVKPYIAFYRVVNSSVFIYRVVHGTSNYPALYEKIMHSESE